MLYTHGYVHRDIKPENIMIKGNTYKLGDFGLASKFDRKNNKFRMREYCGSPLYESP